MGKILRAVTNDGTAKISVITAPDMVERARELHHLHPVGTAALGRTLCGASLLGEMLKEDNAALTLRIQGGGPIGTILAVSDNAGNVRGYVSHPEVDLPIRERDGKLDVSGAVGREGLLTVSRDIGLREPVLRFLRARERRDRRGPRGVSHRKRPARLGVRARRARESGRQRQGRGRLYHAAHAERRRGDGQGAGGQYLPHGPAYDHP